MSCHGCGNTTFCMSRTDAYTSWKKYASRVVVEWFLKNTFWSRRLERRLKRRLAKSPDVVSDVSLKIILIFFVCKIPCISKFMPVLANQIASFGNTDRSTSGRGSKIYNWVPLFNTLYRFRGAGQMIRGGRMPSLHLYVHNSGFCYMSTVSLYTT